MGIFQPDKMGGVDYGEALKKIETAIANKDKANAGANAGEIDSSTVKNKTAEESGNLNGDEDDNHDDLYNQVIDEDGDIVREGEPT